MKKIVYLAGLPRSGSTVLANILAMHPNINATSSSPLCSIVQGMRRQWSDDPFLLSQLDSNFEMVHKRLKRSTNAFMQAWVDETKKPIVVDKNRGWLMMLETLRELDPEFKMIITLRDLRRVFSSIEKRHRKTLFLDFPDHMEHNLIDVRANNLFSDNGLIGSILKGLQNIADIPDISKHLYYWRYEDLINAPQETMNGVFEFLGVDGIEIDFENITQSTKEADSYYRMKYPHSVKTELSIPEQAPISPRILNEITNRFRWYYDMYYIDVVRAETRPLDEGSVDNIDSIKNLDESKELEGLDDEEINIVEKLSSAIQEEIGDVKPSSKLQKSAKPLHGNVEENKNKGSFSNNRMK